MISSWAGGNILIAIVLVALASLVLGMGLPVTAAYIVLATLSAPALAGMISDQFVIQQLAAGTLGEGAKAVLMLGMPDLMAALADPMPQAEAASIVRNLPLEIAAPLRNQVVPAPVATAALLSAHMIVFWLSQDSNVTPPVALAAFTAAAIAKSPAMATGVASWKLAKGLYIVPVLFAYTPFLSGDWPAMLQVFGFAVVGVYALSAGLQGCMERPFFRPVRIVCFAAGTAAMWPGLFWVNVAGVLTVLGLLVWNVRSASPRATPETPAQADG
jgi:TRAP-type uncharacterized transport system fused permease subunit